MKLRKSVISSNCTVFSKLKNLNKDHINYYHGKKLCAMAKLPLLSDTELGVYDKWKEKNFYKNDSKEIFSMMLPPPNVTGKLHMGHAVTCTIEDAIVRWNHMHGKKVSWIPGFDHAGIATQIVVQKYLWRSRKVSHSDLGKKKFINEVWKWKKEKESEISNQMKRLGLMMDWNKSYFTLDQNIADGVFEAFTMLYNRGLIYRGNYMVNWCCNLQSAISDFEVEMKSIEKPIEITVPGHKKKVKFGYIYYIKFLVENEDDHLTVATTRPETLLGDTALMVHPDDPRYTKFHGKNVIHPLNNCSIPILVHRDVSMIIGTGAVKVTPGHSFQDFDLGRTFGLPIIEIMNDSGVIVVDGIAKGLPRYEAREVILNYLSSKDLLQEWRPNPMQLPHCMRSGDVIEPRLKTQWFLATKNMAQRALDSVKNGDLRLHPPEHGTIWQEFLSKDRDWCISRQLWWGHQIPMYWVSLNEKSEYGRNEEITNKKSVFVAARNVDDAAEKASVILDCKIESIRTIGQERDVLDTWFSSSLLPFVVHGWPGSKNNAKFSHNNSNFSHNNSERSNFPLDSSNFSPDISSTSRIGSNTNSNTSENSPDSSENNLNLNKNSNLCDTDKPPKIVDFDSKNLFPLSLMETGHDILFFWVARMVMLSLELTGKLPFKDVLLHGLICDSKGQKMSKSKGNVIDPMSIIEGHVDNLKNGNDINNMSGLGADALRFSLSCLDLKRRDISFDIRNVEQCNFFRNKMWQTFRFLLHHTQLIPNSEKCLAPISFENIHDVMDRWILSQLSTVVSQSNEGFQTFKINVGALAFRNFWTNSLCDVYMEACKLRLWNHETNPESALRCLQTLWTCCDVGCRVVAPYMPFLSDKLYSHLPYFNEKSESVFKCPYPKSDEWSLFKDSKLDKEMNEILLAVSALRSLRKSYNITSKSQQGKGSIFIRNKETHKTAMKLTKEIERLSFLSKVTVENDKTFEKTAKTVFSENMKKLPEMNSELSQNCKNSEMYQKSIIKSEKLGKNGKKLSEIVCKSQGLEAENQGIAVHPLSPDLVARIHLEGLIEPTKELKRLNKKKSKLTKKRDDLNNKIEKIKSFNNEVKNEQYEKLSKYDDELNHLNGLIENVQRML